MEEEYEGEEMEEKVLDGMKEEEEEEEERDEVNRPDSATLKALVEMVVAVVVGKFDLSISAAYFTCC